MKPRTKLNRVRFTDEETIGLANIACRLRVPKAAVVRAFVRLGIARTASGSTLEELRAAVSLDIVKRGRELGYSPRPKASEPAAVSA